MSDFIRYSEKKYGPLGPKSAAIISKIDEYTPPNYPAYPFVVSKAKGAWLYDPDGNKALDFLAAYSAVLSHRHKGVMNAVMKEMKKGSDLCSRALYPARLADLTEMIAQVTGYDKTLPKSDGGSATDSALKGLFMHAVERGIKKPNIVLTENYFHGRNLCFVTNALFDDNQVAGIPVKFPGIKVVKDTIEDITKAVNNNTIGVFIETHKGEGGPLFSNKDYFMAIRNLTKEKGIFFGTDEIQTGLGRCGYILAWQEYGEEARPDFVTLGKALGGGVIPVSAVVGTNEFMNIYKANTDGSTFGGYSIACAAACASLKYIVEEGISERAKEIGDYFVAQFQGVPGINVENRGALIRVELEGVDTAKHACLEMLLGKNRELRVFMKHGHSDPERNVAYTRIAPPIGAMTEKLIDRAVEETIIPVLTKANY